MSKILKALERARTTAPVSPSNVRGLVPVAAPAASSTQVVERRAQATQEIARMQEVVLRGKGELGRSGIIYPEIGDNATVQALRELRTKVIQKTDGRNCTVLVISLVRQGGGSFVAFNLAAAFGFDVGRTALLVDCNLRDPSLPRIFGQTAEPGLIDYLEDPSMDIASIIHPVGIERVRVVPAGGRREVPAEYFTSDKMRRLLGDLRDRYPERYVILDGPPASDAADVHTLVDLSDYVLLVVPYARATVQQIERAVKDIPATKLIGVVFNDAPDLPPVKARGAVHGVREWLRDWFTASLRGKPAAN